MFSSFCTTSACIIIHVISHCVSSRREGKKKKRRRNKLIVSWECKLTLRYDRPRIDNSLLQYIKNSAPSRATFASASSGDDRSLRYAPSEFRISLSRASSCHWRFFGRKSRSGCAARAKVRRRNYIAYPPVRGDKRREYEIEHVLRTLSTDRHIIISK